jgi:hypothetical protein
VTASSAFSPRRIARAASLAWVALVFGIAFALYHANGDCICLYDSMPNSLLTFQVLQRQRVDFDNFRGGYLFDLGAGYAFAEAPNGHLASIFPMGTAIVAAPIYAGLDLEAKALGQPLKLTDRSFEDLRRHFEKEVACLLGALAVALFFMCARRIAPPFVAAVATAVFAFGTEMWTIGSQALWQHGPINLFVLLMFYAFLRSEASGPGSKRSFWLALAGAAGGFLWVIRPTAIVFGAAGLIFAALYYRREAWPAVLAFLAGTIPGLLWNAYFFHSLLGGYAFNVARYAFDPLENLRTLAAITFSPSRGLFTFSPVLLFSIAGAVACFRRRDATARLLAALGVAAACSIFSFAFFTEWWGGFSFGPRYLSDVAAVGALLLVYVIPARPRTWIRANAGRAGAAAAFALALSWSVGVQAAGAFGEERSDWNGIPFSVDTDNARLFELDDSQIARDAAFAIGRFVPDPTLVPGYVERYSGRILHVEAYPIGALLTALDVAPATPTDLRVELANEGAVTWYGYRSGVYAGQTLVRARLLDAAGRAATTEQHLFVAGDVAPGERARAEGTLVAPEAPGTYRLVLDVIPHRIDQSKMPPARPFRLEVTVR